LAVLSLFSLCQCVRRLLCFFNLQLLQFIGLQVISRTHRAKILFVAFFAFPEFHVARATPSVEVVVRVVSEKIGGAEEAEVGLAVADPVLWLVSKGYAGGR
jgi:hypothetical protein